MLIECPSCTRSYHVTRAALGPTGRAVICAHCDIRWFVAPDGSAAWTAEPAEAPEINAEAQSERSRPPRYEELYGPAARPREPAARAAWPRVSPAVALVTALLALPSLLIAARRPVVAHLPQAGRLFAAIGLPVNLPGLSLAGIETHRGGAGRDNLLDVEGDIGNVRGRTTAVPPLRLTVLDGQGQPIYAWTAPAPRPELAAGAHVTFHARLAAPPAAGRTVVVRFASAAEAGDPPR